MNFLDTTVYKGKRFDRNLILDFKTYIKSTNTFQYLDHSSAHNPSVFKGFIKGETIRHVRNTTDTAACNEILNEFKLNLKKRGYSRIEINQII